MFGAAAAPALASKHHRRANPLVECGKAINRLALPPSASAPDATALAQFGALRQSAGPADRPPPDPSLAIVLGSYDSGYVRQLQLAPDGEHYVLVPGELQLRVPRVCLALLPADQRRALQREANRLAGHPVAGYCLIDVRRDGSIADTPQCDSFAAVQSGFEIGAADVFSSTARIYGLVPDGVATVSVSFHRQATLTAAVSNNSFVASGPSEATHPPSRRLLRGRHPRRALLRLLNDLVPTQVQWLDGRGTVLHQFNP